MWTELRARCSRRGSGFEAPDFDAARLRAICRNRSRSSASSGMLLGVGWFGGSALSSGPPPLPSGLHRFVVVDVETSGLYPASCRVLSVAALALDELGRPEGRVVSLIDAGCDPGPVHVHGLTRQRLAGAPRYADVLPQLHDILDGRVMVAHNASFDYGFLAAEASRAGTTLPTRRRLCTLALSRRLGVPVPNHKLGTLAAHWNVPPPQRSRLTRRRRSPDRSLRPFGGSRVPPGPAVTGGRL